jgi:hypothetical protein
MPEEPNLQSQTPNAKSNNPEPKGYDKTIAHWTRILGISTIVLSIATVISAYFLHQTDETIKNQARVQLRAYVGMQGFYEWNIVKKEEGKPDVIHGGNVAISWKNFGSTPASQMDNWISARWYNTGLEPDFSVPIERISDKRSAGLGPGGDVLSGVAFVPISDFEKSFVGNGRIFMWGHITYKDVFVDTPIRNFHFCGIVVGKPPEGVAYQAYKAECNYSN